MARNEGSKDEKKIASRSEDYSQWYIDIVLRAELADYAPDIKGCMVIRPHGYAIWELMQRSLDGMFKETGHQNAYFPLFIPESYIQREKEHFEALRYAGTMVPYRNEVADVYSQIEAFYSFAKRHYVLFRSGTFVAEELLQ